MNIKKLWMPVFALLLSSTVISAQEQRIKPKIRNYHPIHD